MTIENRMTGVEGNNDGTGVLTRMVKCFYLVKIVE